MRTQEHHVLTAIAFLFVAVLCVLLMMIADPYLKQGAARDGASAMSPNFGRVVGVAQSSTAQEAENAKKLGEAYKATGEGDLAKEKAITERQTRDANKYGWVGVALREDSGGLCGSLSVLVVGVFVLGMFAMWKITSRKGSDYE